MEKYLDDVATFPVNKVDIIHQTVDRLKAKLKELRVKKRKDAKQKKPRRREKRKYFNCCHIRGNGRVE